jgi:serine/threonine protein kinase
MHVCPKCGDSADEPGECARDKVALTDAEGDEHLGLQIGPYRIARLLGAGGMGRVYLAVHPEIGSRVAIKIFSRDWDTRSDLVDRFFAEARATNLIRHESIINVLDVNRLDSGRPYMVMEHLRGLPLSKLIEDRKLTDSGIISIMLDVLAGLDAAHAHTIIHRDLKPENIYVSPEGHATLLDFGVAKLVPELLGDSGPTTTGAILGTPHYMSPEQAVGDPIDVRTDIYALGIILYECFTYHRPFDASSLYKLLDQHVHKEPRAPRSYRPEISEEVEAVILRALAKKPKDRYQTAAQMRHALEDCQAVGRSSKQMRIRLDTADEDAHVVVDPLEATVDDSGHEEEEKEQDTAATVAASPRRRKADANLPPKRKVASAVEEHSFGFWLVGSGLAIVAVVWLFVALGKDRSSAPERARFGYAVTDASTQEPGPSPVPSRPLDASTLTTPVPALDAALPPDAGLPDAGPPDAAPKKRGPRGIAPFSLYAIAQARAARSKGDAILSRVHIEGLNDKGRVRLGEAGTRVKFVFSSPIAARRVLARPRSNTTRGFCYVAVTFTSSREPAVGNEFGECAKQSFVPPPTCSVAKIIKQAVAARQIELVKGKKLSLTYKQVVGRFSSSYSWRIGVGTTRGRGVNGCK